MSITVVRRACAVALPVALSLAGCGDNERLASTEMEAGPSIPDAGAEAAPPVDAEPAIRRVEYRNPFGNTDISNNLMVDGDFELTSASGQFGWQAYTNGGNVELIRETGGLCHSGVVCGVLQPSVALLGLAAAPRDEPIEVNAWGRPGATKDCYSISITLVGCSSGSISTFGSHAVGPLADDPDSDGWCHYQAVSTAFKQQPCIYVTAKVDATEKALLDDVSLTAAKGSGQRQLMTTVPTREFQERLIRDLDWMQSHKRFGRPLPTRP